MSIHGFSLIFPARLSALVANVGDIAVNGETAAANSQRVVPSELRRMRPEGELMSKTSAAM